MLFHYKSNLTRNFFLSLNLTIKLSIVFLTTIFSFVSPNHAQAQTLTASGSAQISASIPENAPPSTPILISPENNAIINDKTPSFIWQESIDDRRMSHYQLYLDGEILYNNIPLLPTDNTNYTLSYDSITKQYILTVKNNIEDGSHSWKIRALDVLNNYADSITWNFTIDSKAPYLTITNIEEKNTAKENWSNELDPHISSQDDSTIPTQPIEFDFNELLLAGTGEKNSNVILKISIPDESSKTYEFEINGDGRWELQLGILPRGKILKLDFTITDQVGFVSVLENVLVLIKMPAIIFPPQDPTPIIIPGEATPTPSPPRESTGSGTLILPYLPPKEIVHEIIEEIGSFIPQPAIDFASAIPKETKKIIVISFNIFKPFLALLIALFIPTSGVLLVASKFDNPLSWLLLKKIALAIGVFSKKDRQGIVVEDETGAGVPFSMITVTGIDDFSYIKDSAMTDQDGFYGGLKLPVGKYRLSSRDNDYLFPTGKVRKNIGFPQCLHQENYYQGQIFKVTQNNNLPKFIIPVTRTNYEKKSLFLDKLRAQMAYLNEYPTHFLMGITILVMFICLVYPFISNWLVLAGYSLVWIKKIYLGKTQKIIYIRAINIKTSPVENVIVKIESWWHDQNKKPTYIDKIVKTDTNGKSKVRVLGDLDPKQIDKITAWHVNMNWIESPNNDCVGYLNQKTKEELVVVMK